jgi:site-specific DNA-methyltransferase (adenine-specific)
MAKIKFKDIKPDSRNTNKHTEYGMHTLDNSLEQVGIIESVTISNDNVIISGNARHEKIGQKFSKDAIVVETDGTTPIVIKRTDIQSGTKEFHKASILANTVAQKNQNIDVELVEVIADEFDFELEEVFVEVVEEESHLEAQEDDFDATPPETPITVLGDLYEIGEHRLLCGDSTDSDQVAKLMNGQKADMVFTDPPYGVSYTGGHNKKQRTGIIADELQGEDLSSLFEDSINTACIFSKDSAPFYIWYAGGKSKETYLGLSKTPIEVRAVICWYKVKSGSGAFMSQYIPNYEPCIYGHKEGKTIQWFGPTDEKTVWEFKKDNTNDYHPTQKPIDVVERALNNSSKKGQLIYDAFGGSGSTMVGSHQLKRTANLMELDPKYCDVIVKRMIKLDPTLVIKRNGVVIDKKEFDDN